tara:strand:- start:916 stop:3108 length:2193 start_codon:yes stop_codon:yes gene_type:complete
VVLPYGWPVNKSTTSGVIMDRPIFKKTPLALAVTASIVTLAAMPVQANDSDTGIETVQVTGVQPTESASSSKFTRSLLDTAQTVNIIPKSLIEQRAATSLRDVLRNVSGISMQAGEGGAPAGDQLSIRGYSARTDIFVDNVRDFGGYTRDPFNLEQVEVVKGPSSDYSGRGSTGGSINLVSKSPTLEDSLDTNLALGSDSSSRATLDVNHALDSLDNAAFRLNLLYHDQDVAGRDEVDNSRWGVAPSLAFGIDTDTQVTVSLFHLEQDNLPDYGIPWVPTDNVPLAALADEPAPVDFENWYGLLDRDFEEVSTSLVTLKVDHNLSDNITLTNTARYGITDRDSMITAPRFFSNTSTDIRRSDEKYRDQEDKILANQTDVVIEFGNTWEHKLLVGMDIAVESEKRYTQALTGVDSPNTDLYNPNPNDAYLENYQRTGTASKSDSNSFALYISDSVALNDKWQINAGLRWDRFDLEFVPDGGTLLERDDKMLSYRAGVVYKPVESASIYFGYGTSFNPTAEALSISTSSRQPGIADLDPEENETIELGAKWQVLDGKVFLSGAIFRTEKTNARTEDPNDPNDVLILDGEQEVQGVELGVAGQVTEKLGIFAGYTYLDTEITKSLNAAEVGQELGNSPRNSFNLWSTYNFTEKFDMGLGAQFVDDRYNGTSNLRTADSYWVGEVSANYRFNERISFRLNVQNLTDEEYIDFVGGGHFIPGMGRVAMLSSSFFF